MTPEPILEPPEGALTYPLGRIAFYGPDDRQTTLVVLTIARAADDEPVRRQWLGADVLNRPRVWEEVQSLLDQYGVRRVTIRPGNQGCAHEEGRDYRAGEDCPFCPYWRARR